jgi:NlpC/P60 family
MTTPDLQDGSALGQLFLNEVASFKGVPYVFGGESPAGFDCSGLVQYAASRVGVNVPRTSEAQWAALPHVDSSNVQPGDLVFFQGAPEEAGPPGHVGIVNSTGTTWSMIDAPFTGVDVRQDTFSIPGQGTGSVIGFARLPGVSGGSTVNTSSSIVGNAAQGILSAFGLTSGTITDILERGALMGVGAVFIVIGLRRLSSIQSSKQKPASKPPSSQAGESEDETAESGS